MVDANFTTRQLELNKEYTSFEQCAWVVSSTTKSCIVAIIYRPPTSPGNTITVFTDNLIDLYSKLI